MVVAVSTFQELHAVLEPYRADKRWAFRGHAEADWHLLPKAGRAPFNNVSDGTVFQVWQRQAVAYLSVRPQNDWEWLAVAQHHGLATRLLDWTFNPLIAAYFSVREDANADAKLIAVKFRLFVPHEDRGDPLKFRDVAAFRPHRVAHRITQQQGLFSIHPKPSKPLERTSRDLLDFQEIIIKQSFRKTLRSQLSFYGFNEANLFPDLDGVSRFVNWTIESREYWRFPPNDIPQD